MTSAEARVVAFLDERRSRPWTGGLWNATARARALYERYVEVMDTADRKVLSQNEFGIAVQSAGFSRDRDSDGYYYEGVTVETREERADEQTAHAFGSPASRAYIDAEKKGHIARHHPDQDDYCGHVTPEQVYALAREARDAAVEAARADGSFAAERERVYGAYLRWRPGDDSPAKAAARAAGGQVWADWLRTAAVLAAWDGAQGALSAW